MGILPTVHWACLHVSGGVNASYHAMLLFLSGVSADTGVKHCFSGQYITAGLGGQLSVSIMAAQYTPEQRLFIYTEKVQGTTYNNLQTLFLQKFGIPAPHRRTCNKIKRKISTEYTCHNLNMGRSGRKRTARSDENILLTMGSAIESPRIGLRRRAPGLDISRSTLHRILTEDLKLKPYHMQRHQELQIPDHTRRTDFARWYLQKCAVDPYFEDQIWWTDEAHIYMNGYFNSKNCIHWGSTKPTDVVQKPLHPVKVTVWCAISSSGLLGPYFYEENGRNVTVNGIRYLDLLANKFFPELSSFTLDNLLDPEWYFMQDGARPHILTAARNFITSRFDDRTIGERLHTPWPARSPDLTPCDFFLWGCMKDKVNQRIPIINRQHLKDTVVDVVRAIDPYFCMKACQSVKKRCEKLLDPLVQGRHIEQLL